MTKKSHSSLKKILLPIPLAAIPLIIISLFIKKTFFNSHFSVTKQTKNEAILLPSPTISPIMDEINYPTDWRTFSDLNAGYSIRYPSNWIKEDITPDIKKPIPLGIITFRPSIIPSLPLTEDKTDSLGLLSVASISVTPETVKEVVSRIESYGQADSQKEIVIIDKKQGIKLEGKTIVWDYRQQKSTTEKSIVVVLPLESNTLVFSFTPEPVIYNENYSDVFERMLDSLTISSHKIISTKEWKTHQDLERGFIFKYPPDWYLDYSERKGELFDFFGATTLSTYDPNPFSRDWKQFRLTANDLKVTLSWSNSTLRTDQSLVNWVKERINEDEMLVESSAEIKLGKKNIFHLSSKGVKMGGEYSLYFIPHDNKVFIISGSPFNSVYQASLKKLIETFEFLPTNTIPTSNSLK